MIEFDDTMACPDHPWAFVVTGTSMGTPWYPFRCMDCGRNVVRPDPWEVDLSRLHPVDDGDLA